MITVKVFKLNFYFENSGKGPNLTLPNGEGTATAQYQRRWRRLMILGFGEWKDWLLKNGGWGVAQEGKEKRAKGSSHKQMGAWKLGWQGGAEQVHVCSQNDKTGTGYQDNLTLFAYS